MSQASDREALETDLVAWGRVIVLETSGRISRLPRRVSVGFVQDTDGALLIAASHESADWARNLQADPACSVERDGVREARRAVQLEGDGRDQAVRSLILKYGTPSERLGAGPAFRLERVEPPMPIVRSG